MSNPETRSHIPEVRRAIADADGLYVPNYTNYGTGAALDANLAQLALDSERGAHPGVAITRQPVGPRGHNFVKTVFKFDEPGFNATIFVRPHKDEELGLRVVENVANIACHQRGLFVRRGVGQIAVYDVTNEDSGNDWHFCEHTYGNYVQGSDRGEDHDWRYPTVFGEFDKTTPNSQAGRQVIDEERPAVLDAEHSANLGSYFANTENAPPDFAQAQSELMREVNHGLPPTPSDDPNPHKLAEGVYRLRTWAEMVPDIYGKKKYTREQLTSFGDNPLHYAGRTYGTIGYIYEQALFIYEALLDNEPAQPYHEALGDALCRGLAVVDFVEEVAGKVQVQKENPVWSKRRELIFSATHWRQELTQKLDALHDGEIENPLEIISGAQVANLSVRKHAMPVKMLGSLNQLVSLDNSFRPFRNEVIDRTQAEAAFLTDKLQIVAVRPAELVRAKIASFLLNCESAHKQLLHR